jgi:hypothetical protein
MKKTLLIAAAALVAATITSEAQVYSANIVGYVNHVYSHNAKFELVATPLDASNGGANPTGNSLTNLFPGINGATIIQVWNPTAGSFDSYKISGGAWQNLANFANADNFQLAPGVGYFVTLGGSKSYTNTIVGNVECVVPGSVTNIIQNGLQLEGSVIPYGDYITNTATFNLIGKGGSILQQWDIPSQAFVGFKISGGVWQNLNTLTAQTPQIGVGEGFFFTPSGTSSNIWVESLQ